MPDQKTYRTGLLCDVAGVQYWHTGYQYFVALGDPAGPQKDLREFQGFKDVDAKYYRVTSMFADDEWGVIAEGEPAVAAALSVLEARAEMWWWSLVESFLRKRHSEGQLRSRAAHALRAGGMSEADIKAALCA